MCARFTGRRSSSELAAVGFGLRIVWSKTKSLEAPVLVAGQLSGYQKELDEKLSACVMTYTSRTSCSTSG